MGWGNGRCVGWGEMGWDEKREDEGEAGVRWLVDGIGNYLYLV